MHKIKYLMTLQSKVFFAISKLYLFQNFKNSVLWFNDKLMRLWIYYSTPFKL